MNRRLLPALLALLSLLAGAALLIAPVAADPPKKDDDPPKTTTVAAKPKPLSKQAIAAVGYLIKQQQPDGGWPAGDNFALGVGGFGGFAGVGGGAPQPGKPGAKPMVQTDVANTSIVSLAMLRGGYSPKGGNYSKNLHNAIVFVCKEIEQSDKESLAITDNAATLVQGKIGKYVDTFLAALLLAEARGKMYDAKTNQRVEEALKKVVKKMEANQKKDGTWDGGAWAPVLGQALATRALNRAKQVGVAVDPQTLERAAKHAQDNFEKAMKAKAQLEGAAKDIVPGVPGIPGFPGVMGLDGAAGIQLYASAAGIGGLQDSLFTARQAGDLAKHILDSPASTEKEKNEAWEQVKKAEQADKLFLDAANELAKKVIDKQFVAGFGSDGGEEFLSFMLIGDALRAQNSKEWAAFDKTITDRLTKSQNQDGSWSGNHCITGKSFCTASALLALMADRAPIPAMGGK